MTSYSVLGNTNAVLTDSKSFTLTFKNPCVDQNYVSIVAPVLDNINYFIYDPAQTMPPHAEFIVNT